MRLLILSCFAFVYAKQLSAQIEQVELRGCEKTISSFALSSDEKLVYGIDYSSLFVWNAYNGELIGQKDIYALTKSVVIDGVDCKGNFGRTKLDVATNRLFVLGDQYQKLLPDGSKVYYHGVIHILSLDPLDNSVKTYVLPNELKPTAVAVNPLKADEFILCGSIKKRQVISIFTLDSMKLTSFLFNEEVDFKSSSYPFFNSNPITFSSDGKFVYVGFGLKGVKGGFMFYDLEKGTSKKLVTNFVPEKIILSDEEITVITKSKLTLIYDRNTLVQKKTYPANYLAISSDKKYALERNLDSYLVFIKDFQQGSSKALTDFRIADLAFNKAGDKLIISRLKGYLETLEEDQKNPSLYIIDFKP